MDTCAAGDFYRACRYCHFDRLTERQVWRRIDTGQGDCCVPPSNLRNRRHPCSLRSVRPVHPAHQLGYLELPDPFTTHDRRASINPIRPYSSATTRQPNVGTFAIASPAQPTTTFTQRPREADMFRTAERFLSREPNSCTSFAEGICPRMGALP
jgi:hypothetical protein